MVMRIVVQPAACGAWVHGLDLRQVPDPALSTELRALWLAHQVLAFPIRRWRWPTWSALPR